MHPAARLLLTLFLISGFSSGYAQEYPYNEIHWKNALGKGVDARAFFHGESGMIAGLLNGKLVLAGGQKWIGGKPVYLNDFYIFKTGDQPADGLPAFKLDQKTANAGVGYASGQLIYAGGENASGLLTAVRLITLNIDGQVKAMVLPDLPLGLRHPAVLLHNRQVYITGGESSDGRSNQFLMLDLDRSTRGWVNLAPIPAGETAPVLFAQSDGEVSAVYMAGTGIALYDSRNNKWQQQLDEGVLRQGLRSVIAAGSTHAVLAAGLTGDSLFLFSTITKKLSFLDTLPGPHSVSTVLLKDDSGIWLMKQDAGGERSAWKGALENYTFFSIWDYAVVIGYLLLTVFIGLRFSGKHQSTNTYFKGDGKIPAWAVGISILGAQISAISFMSTPAKVYATNWNYFLLSVAVVLVIPVVNRYFIPFYRRLNITSAYEYLDKRFNYPMRFIASALYILFELGRLAIILILPSLALAVVTGIDVNLCVLVMGLITLVYTFKGGIKAVIWTDVMQVFVLFGGSLLCIIYILFYLPGNVHELSHTIIVNNKFKLLENQLNLTSPNVWVVLIGGFTLSFLPYSTDQTTVQRYLTTKNEKDARKSVRVSAWISIPATVLFMGIGTLLYLFYFYHPNEVNISHQSQDAIFPWFIVSQLPSGIRGLLVAGIFAATMSSLSSSLTSASTAFITDFYSVLFTKKTQQKYLKAARLATLSIGMLSIVIALYIINKGVVSLWDQYNIFMGLFTGGIGGVFCLGIFTTRANATGAIGGLILSSIVLYLVSHYTKVHFLLYATIGLGLCFVFGLLISVLFSRSTKSLDGLTIHTQVNKEDNA